MVKSKHSFSHTSHTSHFCFAPPMSYYPPSLFTYLEPPPILNVWIIWGISNPCANACINRKVSNRRATDQLHPTNCIQSAASDQLRPTSCIRPDASNQLQPTPDATDQLHPTSCNQPAATDQMQSPSCNRPAATSQLHPTRCNRPAATNQLQPASCTQPAASSQLQPTSCNRPAASNQLHLQVKGQATHKWATKPLGAILLDPPSLGELAPLPAGPAEHPSNGINASSKLSITMPSSC